MTDSVTLWVSERLLTASVQGAGVIALVWLICRSLPRIPASVHAALWWLAALKLVLVMLPVPALHVRLPAAPDVYRNASAALMDWGRESPSPSPTVAPRLDAVRRNAAAPVVHTATGTPVEAMDSAGVRWLEAVILLWFGVVVLQAGRLVTAFRTLRAVVRRSARWTDDEAGTVARLSALVGLRHTPQVRTSDEIPAPQVVGLWRPVILVPGEAVTALTAEERAMTLCHELMHIRRHDLALGWVPALAERLFFFHPLARLAAREYIAARESACDAAVVRALDVSPTDYGRMLVRLGVAGSEPALTAGTSPLSISSLKRRLEMLQHASSPDASRRSTWLIAAIACALVPLRLVAGTPGVPQRVPEAPPPVVAPQVVVPVVPILPVEIVAPRVAAPVDPPPVERAPSQPALAAEALPQDERASGAQDAERAAFAEVLRRYADALRQKPTDPAITLELERQAAELQNSERQMQRMMELVKRGLMSQSAANRIERDSRQSRELMLELIGQRQTGDLNAQVEELNKQVEILNQQLEQIAEQQAQLAATQQRLTEQVELIRRLSENMERIRKALEAR